MFMGWANFSIPWLYKTMSEHPDKIVSMMKMRMLKETAFGDKKQPEPWRHQDWMQGSAFVLDKDLIKNGNLDLNDERGQKVLSYAIQDPIAVSIGMFNSMFPGAMEKFGVSNGTTSDNSLNAFSYTVAHALHDVMLGKDSMTGKDLDWLPKRPIELTPSSITESANNAIATRWATSWLTKPVQNVAAMIDLAGEMSSYFQLKLKWNKLAAEQSGIQDHGTKEPKFNVTPDITRGIRALTGQPIYEENLDKNWQNRQKNAIMKTNADIDPVEEFLRKYKVE
jgi:hypothetical protein